MRRLEWAALFTTQPRSWKRSIGFLAALLVAGWIGAAAALSPPEHPIILVHGLNSDASTWDEFLASVTSQGWTFGGQARYRNGQIYYFPDARFGGRIKPGDIYTVSFTSGKDLTYQQQGEELEGVINFILELTGKSKAICVGHSMGGLACRAYLSYARTPKVSQIITVGTPHLGSNFANIAAVAGFSGAITAVRILQPNSLELNQLNTDALYRYRDTPIAYSSIIVGNDDVVNERSQNLASAELRVPLHAEVRINLLNACTLNRFNHLCETADDNVRIAITAEVVRRPVALVLKTETPRTRIGSPLRIKLSASSGNRVADLYTAILTPSRQFVFQTAIESGEPGWTITATPAAHRLDSEELYPIRFDSLGRGSDGEYTFYALLVRPTQSPYDGTRVSNLAQTTFQIAPPDSARTAIENIFVSTYNNPYRWESPWTSGYRIHIEVIVSDERGSAADYVSRVEARSRRTGEVIVIDLDWRLPNSNASYIFEQDYGGESGVFDITVTTTDGRTVRGASHSLDRPRQLPLPQGLNIDSVSPTRFWFEPVPGASRYWCWVYTRFAPRRAIYNCPASTTPSFTLPANLFRDEWYVIVAFAAEIDAIEPSDDPSRNENVSTNNLFLWPGREYSAANY
ncbi:alpha/beta fold hydrolase [Candidatus Parcubacteria bacterium]|nr:alpha/beta fold hydrolase [Candidatus Parcubacteria bacterium]